MLNQLLPLLLLMSFGTCLFPKSELKKMKHKNEILVPLAEKYFDRRLNDMWDKEKDALAEKVGKTLADEKDVVKVLKHIGLIPKTGDAAENTITVLIEKNVAAFQGKTTLQESTDEIPLDEDLLAHVKIIFDESDTALKDIYSNFYEKLKKKQKKETIAIASSALIQDLHLQCFQRNCKDRPTFAKDRDLDRKNDLIDPTFKFLQLRMQILSSLLFFTTPQPSKTADDKTAGDPTHDNSQNDNTDPDSTRSCSWPCGTGWTVTTIIGFIVLLFSITGFIFRAELAKYFPSFSGPPPDIKEPPLPPSGTDDPPDNPSDDITSTTMVLALFGLLLLLAAIYWLFSGQQPAAQVQPAFQPQMPSRDRARKRQRRKDDKKRDKRKIKKVAEKRKIKAKRDHYVTSDS